MGLTQAQIDAANQETINNIMKMQKEIQERAEKQIAKAEKKATTTYENLRIMIWIAFAVGVVLIFVSLAIYVFTGKSIETLGLATLGVADWVAIFLYKPMDRLQKANADYAQQFAIMSGFSIMVTLYLLAMDSNQRDDVKAVAKAINSGSIDTATSLQKFIE